VRDFVLILPGPIDQLTGGYLYARHLVDGIGAAVSVCELPGRFPMADTAARASAAAALAALPDGACAVIDGLALAGFAECLPREANRLRLVAFVHHPLAEETGLDAVEQRQFAALESLLLPLFAGAICPSAETAAALEAYGCTRIAIVPPGTLAGTRIDRSARRPPWELLSVATLTPRKGHEVLIAALARLADREWWLTLIGSLDRDPACVERVRAAVAAHRLEDRVNFAGEWPQPRVRAAYEAADIFVLASFHEGYGMALAEAMAFGLPVVTTRAGAIPETVPESAGIFVPPGDALALAAALARVMDDAALRARLNVGAAAVALPRWDETVRRWAAAAEKFFT
jgi:glycosyltransferase involved in cell wall biosynthesis